MKSQRIETIRKRFQKEWPLIRVEKMDDATTSPLSGRLLAPSPHRDEIYRQEMKYKTHTLTVYSEEGLPKGYAAAF